MTLERLLELIKECVGDRLIDLDTCKLAFEINIAKGGIGNCKVTTEKLIEKI